MSDACFSAMQIYDELISLLFLEHVGVMQACQVSSNIRESSEIVHDIHGLTAILQNLTECSAFD